MDTINPLYVMAFIVVCCVPELVNLVRVLVKAQ